MDLGGDRGSFADGQSISGRTAHSDFDLVSTCKIDSTTAQNMGLGCPKRPRSSLSSSIEQTSAREKRTFFLELLGTQKYLDLRASGDG